VNEQRVDVSLKNGLDRQAQNRSAYIVIIISVLGDISFGLKYGFFSGLLVGCTIALVLCVFVRALPVRAIRPESILRAHSESQARQKMIRSKAFSNRDTLN
jgi:hypothetical protein